MKVAFRLDMKTSIYILALIVSVCAGFAADEKPVTFTTLLGEKFENVTVAVATPLEINVTTAKGVKRVSFSNLSPELQKQFGYDPAKAAAFIDRQNGTVIVKEAKKIEKHPASNPSSKQAEVDYIKAEFARRFARGENPVYNHTLKRFYSSPEEAEYDQRQFMRFIFSQGKGGH